MFTFVGTSFLRRAFVMHADAKPASPGPPPRRTQRANRLQDMEPGVQRPGLVDDVLRGRDPVDHAVGDSGAGRSLPGDEPHTHAVLCTQGDLRTHGDRSSSLELEPEPPCQRGQD